MNRRGGLTVAFPLGKRAVRCARKEHRNHIRRRAVKSSCAVDKQARASSLARISAAWRDPSPVCTTPDIAAALAGTYLPILARKQKPRICTNLVAVVCPRHEIAAGRVSAPPAVSGSLRSNRDRTVNSRIRTARRLPRC
jgi:hypothetical protein